MYSRFMSHVGLSFFILSIQVRPWYKTEIIIKYYIYLVKTHICWWYYIWVIINCFYWNQNVYTAKILIFNNYYEYFNLRQKAHLYLTSKEYNNYNVLYGFLLCPMSAIYFIYTDRFTKHTRPHVSFNNLLFLFFRFILKHHNSKFVDFIPFKGVRWSSRWYYFFFQMKIWL